MAARIGRFFKLMTIAAKMDLAWLLRDTRYAVVAILTDIVANVSTVSGVFLIALRFDGIGGMSADEVLFMTAYNTLTTGIFLLFSSGNSIHISRVIGRGQLEHMFMQPLSLKMQLLSSGFAPFTGSGNFITGIILLLFAVSRLSLRMTAEWVALLVLHLAATMTIIIARAYLVSSAAFYAPTAAEEISSVVINGTWFLSTFPLSGMPRTVQLPLLTVLPDGLMAWFPALCLLGKPPFAFGEYYPFMVALLLSLIARRFFMKGLNYYVRQGSNRYLPYGFRR